jgi:hypothetical protein
MKTALILTIFFSFASCALSEIAMRSFPERSYRPCDDREVKDPVGKFCYRRCAEYKFLHADLSTNCRRWETDVRDLKNADDFKSFRDGGFVLISEKYLR